MDNNRHDLLRGYVADLVRATTREFIAQEDVHEVLVPFWEALVNGVAEVMQEWNGRHSRSLDMLPEETLANCFKHLDWLSRIRASCVCRGWRVAALEDRSLWTDFYAVLLSDDHMELFRSFILRSGTLPLDIRLRVCHNDYVDHVQLVLGAHTNRIRSIYSPIKELSWIPGDNVPILLESVDIEGNFTLEYAPRLRKLYSSRITIPSDDFLNTNLQSLKGILQHGSAAKLFKVCPNLIRLKIDIEYEDNWSDTPAPRSLEYVSMGNRRLSFPSVSTEAFLLNFHQCNALRRVELQSVRSLVPVMDLFSALGHVVHSLDYRRSGTVLESGFEPRLSVSIEYVDSLSPLPHQMLLELRELTLEAGRTLTGVIPAVERLTLCGFNYRLGDGERIAISVPALRELRVALKLEGWREFDASFSFLQNFLHESLSRSSVHTIIFTGMQQYMAGIDRHNVSPLRLIAENLYLDDHRLDISEPEHATETSYDMQQPEPVVLSPDTAETSSLDQIYANYDPVLWRSPWARSLLRRTG